MPNDCAGYNSYNMRLVWDGHHLWCSWDDPDLNGWLDFLPCRHITKADFFELYTRYIYNHKTGGIIK